MPKIRPNHHQEALFWLPAHRCTHHSIQNKGDPLRQPPCKMELSLTLLDQLCSNQMQKYVVEREIDYHAGRNSSTILVKSSTLFDSTGREIRNGLMLRKMMGCQSHKKRGSHWCTEVKSRITDELDAAHSMYHPRRHFEEAVLRNFSPFNRCFRVDFKTPHSVLLDAADR